MTPRQTYRPEVRRALPALVMQRWLTNIGIRVMFTFLPSFARGTGLSIRQIGLLLTCRDLTGLAAPRTGRLVDQRGTAPVIVVASFIAAAGLGLGAFSAAGLAVGLVVMGLGKIGYDVALNAWVGDEVAYDRRARAFGQLELTWAAAGLVGLPLCGLLIEHVAWWSVPAALGTASMLASLRIRQVLDTSQVHKSADIGSVRIEPRVVRMLMAMAILILSSQLLFISHGLWLEENHNLTPAKIGFAAILFGIIEGLGTLTTAAITDRLGKRNSILIGGTLLMCGTLSLAIWDQTGLPVGLALLACSFLGFEFAFVSSLPLAAELQPQARGQVMGHYLAYGTVVRAGGSLIGTWVYVRIGFDGVMALAAANAAIGLIMIFLVLEEPAPRILA